MTQITIIGAGSVMFTRQITSALLSYPALNDIDLVLNYSVALHHYHSNQLIDVNFQNY